MIGRNNKKSDSNVEEADVVRNACAPSRNRRVTDLLGLVTASATLATIPQSTVPAWRRRKRGRDVALSQQFGWDM